MLTLVGQRPESNEVDMSCMWICSREAPAQSYNCATCGSTSAADGMWSGRQARQGGFGACSVQSGLCRTESVSGIERGSVRVDDDGLKQVRFTKLVLLVF
jgi:hypothetical protein